MRVYTLLVSHSTTHAGINVVTTQHPDPVAALSQLYDPQRPPPPLHEPWANSNILQAYVLLHDASVPGYSQEQYV